MDGDVQTQVPAKASRAENFKMQLDKLGAQFQAVLPPHISVDRFKRIVLTAVSTNPDLLECDQRSLWNACMKAATDGNEPDGRYAALVIFNTKQGKLAQYMPMVMGVLRRARNSGEVSYINAHVVYEGDSFEHWVDDRGEHFKHTPNWRGDRGKPYAVYAVARDKEGNSYIEPMALEQVEKVRATSRAKDSGPWVTFWDEMARKTALRRLCKKLPASGEVVEMLDRDNWLYDAPKELPAPTVDAKAEGVTVEHQKPRQRPRKKLDEFAGEPDPVPAAEEQQSGDPAASEPSPSVSSAAAPPNPEPKADAPQRPAPDYKPPKIGWGGTPAKFHAALAAELTKCPTQDAVTALEAANKGNLEHLAKMGPDLHGAWTQARDERMEALRA